MYSRSANVFRKMKSRVMSRNSGSHSCCQSLYFCSIGNRPKFSEPTFSDAISGDVEVAARSRSSRVMPRPPPVDTLITASQAPLILGRNSWNSSGRGSGRPSSGLRACRWMTAAPASAASIDAWAI